jgi:thioredoxin reductase (NADPH)
MRNSYIDIRAGLRGDATAATIPAVISTCDVADQVYRQEITSAGAGCIAALDAERFLVAQESAKPASDAAA